MKEPQCFNPLNRGNLNQIRKSSCKKQRGRRFQSPKSGKFESNALLVDMMEGRRKQGFNPLNRGNLNQIV